MTVVRFAGALLGALLFVTPARAQEAPDFNWEGALAAGTTLEVLGINGRIEAGPASGGTASVQATREAKRGADPEDVTMAVTEHAGGVRICAVYPTRDGGRTTCDEDGIHGRMEDNDVEVNFVVAVPTGVRFHPTTVNGGIEANDLRGDVKAQSVNGGIMVFGTGTVEAKTVNGEIDAGIGSDSWTGTLSFETVNGQISVRLPATVSAEVEAETVNGGLSSDFPLTMRPGRSWGPRRMEGTIGKGGSRLTLETVNGGIELRRG
ncbi:MAG TPA: DUF4097 family beta strand repeat-containing protein [Gemmatimonadota bacterium]|nr:DUF4097 family beta strand repeat-containing protein [Gemmatimonadota bacterium]